MYTVINKMQWKSTFTKIKSARSSLLSPENVFCNCPHPFLSRHHLQWTKTPTANTHHSNSSKASHGSDCICQSEWSRTSAASKFLPIISLQQQHFMWLSHRQQVLLC